MDALSDFQSSRAWDSRFNLPTCPQTNNPHLYLAISNHILQSHYYLLSKEAIEAFIDGCRTEFPGLYHRWPDRSGGKTSHDELIGIAYNDPSRARAILDYLEDNDGRYNNTDTPDQFPDKSNLYRFPWFICYLRAQAGLPINIANYTTYLVRLASFYFTYNYSKNRNEDSLLQTWIMHKTMKRYPAADFAYNFMTKKLMKKGITPKKLFETYLADHEVFRKWAPDNWN